jgi:hypothetical protein
MPWLRVGLPYSMLAMTALALAGCTAGTPSIGSGPLAYQHSNIIAPAGYSESQIGPDRYRIEVKGPLNTPRERMEKIAATRAAEIGKDQKLGYFKIDSVQHGSHCERFKPGAKAPGSNAGTKTIGYAVTTADVSYAQQPPDASYLNARASFDQLRAELDQDQSASPPADATVQCN